MKATDLAATCLNPVLENPGSIVAGDSGYSECSVGALGVELGTFLRSLDPLVSNLGYGKTSYGVCKMWEGRNNLIYVTCRLQTVTRIIHYQL
jgi:hypothetical protein